MTYSLKWLFGLILVAALALGWWRSLVDSYDRGAEAERQQIRDVLIRLINVGELHERQIETATVRWQIDCGLIQDHERRLRTLESCQ